MGELILPLAMLESAKYGICFVSRPINLLPIPSDIVIKIGREHINRSNYIKVLGLLLDENFFTFEKSVHLLQNLSSS